MQLVLGIPRSEKFDVRRKPFAFMQTFRDAKRANRFRGAPPHRILQERRPWAQSASGGARLRVHVGSMT